MAEYDVFSTGNYAWAGMFLWLCGLISLILAMILLVNYVNNRKLSNLFWSAGFSAQFWVYLMVINGDWEMLINPTFGNFEVLIPQLLMFVVPALLASGMILETLDNKKLVKTLLIYTFVGTCVSIIFLVWQDSFAPTIPRIAGIVLHVPSGIAMIVLPITKNKEDKTGLFFSLGGILLAIVGIFLGLIGIGFDMGTFVNGDVAIDGLVDMMIASFSFIMVGAALCFLAGILLPKKWGPPVPLIELEERTAR
jgi:hypothetical protein